MAFGNSIIARLGLDSRDFREGVATAQAALGGFVTGVASGLISGAAIKSIIEYGDRIQDLSERYTVNAESLQRLGNVAEKEGSSLEGVAKGYNKLIISSSQALGGNEKMIASFAALGITLDDLRTLSPEELMLKIGKGSMNAADLVKILGKSALELVPTLKKLASGAAEFGDAISEDDIKRLDELSDKWKELVTTIRTMGAGILVQIADEIRYIADGLKNVATGIGAQFSAIAALSKGDIASFKREVAVLQESIEAILVDAASGGSEYEEKQRFADAEKAATESAAESVDKSAPSKGPSKSELSAAQKERSRTQLGLDELAEKGPDWSKGNTSSMQAMYAADQARQVRDLEKQADNLLLTQGDQAGARTLLDRADAQRQSIGILSETDKMVGAFRTAWDTSVTGQNIAVIAQEMVAE